ncbi:MAG: hypothetical protein PVG24_03740, partial [Gammaproteobacteria bacterium]
MAPEVSRVTRFWNELKRRHGSGALRCGLAEDLIERLSSRGVFPAIARTSSFNHIDASADLRSVGEALGALYRRGQCPP